MKKLPMEGRCSVGMEPEKISYRTEPENKICYGTEPE